MTLVLLTIAPNAAQITPGATTQLVATGWHDNGTTVDLTSSVAWSSSEGSVAGVVAGLVTGVAAGSAVVTATNASPALAATCVVDVDDVVSTCWSGTPSAFELRMIQPIPSYALEALRQRFLFVVVSDHAPKFGVRAVLQMAVDTELRVALLKMFDLAADVVDSNVCQRRRYLDVDHDMRLMRFLVGPALDALAEVPGVPTQYVDLIRRYSTADYPRYRMSAIAAALCLATAVLVP